MFSEIGTKRTFEKNDAEKLVADYRKGNHLHVQGKLNKQKKQIIMEKQKANRD